MNSRSSNPGVRQGERRTGGKVILIRDAEGIIIGRFKEIERAFFHVQEIFDDKRKIVCAIEQDGVITHEGWILGEIKKVKK